MYNKIYIIGPVGSGKTTLAKVLSNKYNIDYYELDKVVFDDDDGNRKRSNEEINNLFKKIIKKKQWIIEDVGRKIFIEGIREADIVYYLNLSRFEIYKRCITRWVRQRRGKEVYNYKPTIKSLFQMLGWAIDNTKNKDKKLKRILNNCKYYEILRLEDINKLENKKD